MFHDPHWLDGFAQVTKVRACTATAVVETLEVHVGDLLECWKVAGEEQIHFGMHSNHAISSRNYEVYVASKCKPCGGPHP